MRLVQRKLTLLKSILRTYALSELGDSQLKLNLLTQASSELRDRGLDPSARLSPHASFAETCLKPNLRKCALSELARRSPNHIY